MAVHGIHALSTLNGILPFTVIPAKAGNHLFNDLADGVNPSVRWGDDEKSLYINELKMDESRRHGGRITKACRQLVDSATRVAGAVRAKAACNSASRS
jgi:hypothetical protein